MASLVQRSLSRDKYTSRDVTVSRRVSFGRSVDSALSRHVTRLPTELIRERRLALDLSQAEAAKRAGITRAEWNGLENGRRGIGPVNAARFVEVLGGVPEDYLTRPVQPEIEDLRRRVAELERWRDELRDDT